MNQTEKLLQKLALATTHQEAENIAVKLVAQGYKFRPYGGLETNAAVARNGVDTPAAIVERIVNSLEAMVESKNEEALAAGGSRAKSIKDGSDRFFGFPNGSLETVEANDPRRKNTNVTVAFLEGCSQQRPTVMTRDKGCGLTPAMVPDTIEAFHRGSKVHRYDLEGMFHDGGTRALLGASSTLILTRREPNLLDKGAEDRTSVVWIRFQEPNPRVGKIGRFETLVNTKGKIPSLSSKHVREWNVPAVANRIYNQTMKGKSVQTWKKSKRDQVMFQPGTLVTHFDYNMYPYFKPMWDMDYDVGAFLDMMLFDTPLPYRCLDLRSPSSKSKNLNRTANRTMTGTRSRLMRSWRRQDSDKNKTVEHYLNRKVTIAPYEKDPTALEEFGIEVWVTKRTARANEKKTDKLKPPQKSRHKGIRTYMPKGINVVFTHGMGQTCLRQPFSFLCDGPGISTTRGASMSHLQDDIIIHINLQSLSFVCQTEVLSSSRALCVENRISQLIFEKVRKELSADPQLAALARDRINNSLLKNVLISGANVSQRVMEMLQVGHGHRFKLRGVERGKRLPPVILNPNGPTTLKIENTTPLKAIPGKRLVINLQSDCPNNSRLTPLVIAEPPNIFENIIIDGEFQDGRMSVALQVKSTAKPSESDKPDGGITVMFPNAANCISRPRCDFVITKPSAQSKREGGNSNTRVFDLPWKTEYVQVIEEQWKALGWDKYSLGDLKFREDRKGNPVALVRVNIDNWRLRGGCQSSLYKKARQEQLRNAFFFDSCVFLCTLFRNKHRNGDTKGLIWDDKKDAAAMDAFVVAWIARHFSNSKRLNDALDIMEAQ